VENMKKMDAREKIETEKDKVEIMSAINRLDDRVSRLQDCIMVRTCTK
jgi:hypothetical protein